MLLVSLRRGAQALLGSHATRALGTDAAHRLFDIGAKEQSQGVSAVDYLDGFEEEELDGDEEFLSRARTADEGAAADRTRQRTVRVAVIGAPNAGKSTLTNTLVGQLVTAVSRKTNTTRVETLGAATFGDTQLVLHDTPGVVAPENWHGVDQGSRVKSAWRAAAGADVALFLVDAQRQVEAHDPRIPLLIARAGQHLASATGLDDNQKPPRAVLVLNKTDSLKPPSKRLDMLRTVLSELAPLHEFEAMFAVSALKHHGCGALVRHLLSCARPAPWLLPADRAADRGPIAQAMAATQGAMFERLHAELPYSISLRHVSWTDFKDGSVRVEQTLVVPTPAVRKIVVGKDGSAIGQIGIAARKVCEEMFNRRVHLILNVKVTRGRRVREEGDTMVDAYVAEDDDDEEDTV